MVVRFVMSRDATRDQIAERIILNTPLAA